jgi:hypothetical protein
MFEHIEPFPIEGFQRINARCGDDGIVEILKPDDGELYNLCHIIDTGYISCEEAIMSLRNIYDNANIDMLPLYGIEDYEYTTLLDMSQEVEYAIDIIYRAKFHYKDLNNYVREAHQIYYSRKKGFQCPEDIRRSISLIGMAYIELAGGPQNGFIPLSAEEAAMRDALAEQYRLEQLGVYDAPPCTISGLSRMVCDWRRGGKTEQEIATLLYDNGKWCSIAQIGALLHRENTRVNADSMKKYAARLLANPKK